MKNKNILYLITILISLFTFNLNVNAAQELTCVYEKAGLFDIDSTTKMLLIQYESGERVVFANTSDLNIKNFGWKKRENYTIYIDDISVDKKDKDGNLTMCPAYGNLNDTGYATFSETHKSGFSWGYEKLEDGGSYNEVNIPNYLEVQQFDNTAGDWLSTIDGSKYTGSCKYQKTYEDGDTHTIIMNYGEEYAFFTEYDPDKGEYSSVQKLDLIKNKYKFEIASDFLLSEFLYINGGECAPGLSVDRYRNKVSNVMTLYYEAYTTVGASNGVAYFLADVRGVNPITKQKLSLDGHIEPDFINPIEIKNCEQLLGEDISKYFDIIWNLIKIGIPILLIGLGTLDFAQAVFSGKEDDMKKVQGKFIKRIIIAVAIFLIPTILGLLLNLAHNVWGNIGTDICGIIF